MIVFIERQHFESELFSNVPRFVYWPAHHTAHGDAVRMIESFPEPLVAVKCGGCKFSDGFICHICPGADVGYLFMADVTWMA